MSSDKEKVVGGKILVIGDLHISDLFTGKHKDYLSECFDIMAKLNDYVTNMKPSAIVLLGDIVGWTETNIRDRAVLTRLCKIFKDWNDITDNHVYAVRGNHDMKGYPDFQFMLEMNLLINIDHFDFYVSNRAKTPETRFHIVNYGEEHRHLDILEGDNVNNIVLGHNNYTIQGVTTWYSAGDGIELNMLQNFCGVNIVISGHIHIPSPEFYPTMMPSGKECMLFYTGCPTRPMREPNITNYCWLVEYSRDGNVLPVEFELPKVEEVFFDDDTFVQEQDEDELAEKVRKENLKGVLDDLLTYRLNQGNPLEQIDNIPNASEEAKAMAKEYMQTALNMKV